MDEQGGQIPGGELEGLELTQDPGEQVGEMEGEVEQGAIAAEAASAQNGGGSHMATGAAPAAPMGVIQMQAFMAQFMKEIQKKKDKCCSCGSFSCWWY